MISTLTAIIAGIATGILTGLTPGIHPNTIVFLTIPLLIHHQTSWTLPFITALAVTHSLLNHIPSILVGAPDADSALATAPGKRMLLDGKAGKAILLGLKGGLYATGLSLILLPPLTLIIPPLYQLLEPHIPYLISLAFGFMLIDSDDIPQAILITILTGTLGTIVLSLDAVSSSMALFPLLTGLFGTAAIITTLHTTIPEQEQTYLSQPADIIPGTIIGTVSGTAAGFLPGIGPSATIATISSRLKKNEQFIAALGGNNTADAIFSLLALYLLGRPRSGAAIAIQQLTAIDTGIVITLLGTTAIAAATGYLIGRELISPLLTLHHHIDPTQLQQGVIIFLVLGTIATTGITGLGILITATGTGLIAEHWQVRKSLCMACLIIPVLLFHTGITI